MKSTVRRPTTALREIREAKGLRGVHVAAAANISVQQLNNLEQGRQLPKLSTARALAEALGVTVDDIFPVEEAGAA